MFIVAGASAHSSFKKAQLLNRLASMSSVQSFDSQWVYLFDQALNEQQHQSALQLLNDGQSFELRQAASDEIQILVTPRVGTISPWSSKATDIFKNCNGINDNIIPWLWQRKLFFNLFKRNGFLGYHLELKR